jgi:hypothetical protein
MIQHATIINKHAEPNVIEMVKKGEVGIVNAAAYVRRTDRKAQRSADAATVKKMGSKLRTPFASPKKAPETVETIVGKLEKCAKELKELSNKNDMTLSFTAFRFAAARLGELLKTLRELVKDEDDDNTKTKGKHRTPLRSVS